MQDKKPQKKQRYLILWKTHDNTISLKKLTIASTFFKYLKGFILTPRLFNLYQLKFEKTYLFARQCQAKINRYYG